jgi:hypothetical protein
MIRHSCIRKYIGRASFTRSSLIMVLFVISSGVCLLIISDMLLMEGPTHTSVTCRWGQLWIHLGEHRVCLFYHDGKGPLSFKRYSGGPDEVNTPEIYFSPRRARLKALGLQFVSGTYYKSPNEGWAIGFSYYYVLVLCGIIGMLSLRKYVAWTQEVRAKG